jgi:hypothetical protein
MERWFLYDTCSQKPARGRLNHLEVSLTWSVHNALRHTRNNITGIYTDIKLVKLSPDSVHPTQTNYVRTGRLPEIQRSSFGARRTATRDKMYNSSNGRRASEAIRSLESFGAPRY